MWETVDISEIMKMSNITFEVAKLKQLRFQKLLRKKIIHIYTPVLQSFISFTHLLNDALCAEFVFLNDTESVIIAIQKPVLQIVLKSGG